MSKEKKAKPAEAAEPEAQTEANAAETVAGIAPEIAELTAKYEEYADQLLRLKAEYANYKKRTTTEKENAYSEGKCDFVRAILPVVDNFERALAAHAEDKSHKGFAEGMKLIYKQLIDVLEKEDIECIASVDQQFDPELHNAVMHVEDESKDAAVVVEEFQKGYKHKDKVIRHSMVKVAN